MKALVWALLLVACLSSDLFAQQPATFRLSSPDGQTTVKVETDKSIRWSALFKNTPVISPSEAALHLQSGEILGQNPKLKKSEEKSVNTSIKTLLYKKDIIQDQYNELTLHFAGNYGIIFRAYDDGVAYRFFTVRRDSLFILDEKAEFNFDRDYTAFVPYIRDLRGGDKYISSCEPLYEKLKLSAYTPDSLSYVPMLVSLEEGVKAAILDADVEDYPGMFLTIDDKTQQGFRGVYAPYPLEEKPGGFNNFNYMATKRANYIAKTKGKRAFPWRAVVISENDADLANSDIVYKLAAPNRIADPSWIKPGKVAWDWWNNWGISEVDFKVGINTETYKYFIDFAAENKLEYIIMDEGWSESTNMKNISPAIDLEEIIAYGRQKNVGVILWATWLGLAADLEGIFAKYAAMGAKGFKIDFLDRDDQKMVVSMYDIAHKAAEHKLIINFHGAFKPTGLQRAYPNVINYEAVNGLENAKWSNNDMPGLAATIPFTRMLAGPMDYTPGAMHNANKSAFRAIHETPMSQGTRCHQIAMYVIFEGPLQMLADSPTNYKREQESTDFISKIPTVFNETIALEGEVGEYVAIARRKGDTWYIGALTNWQEREIELDLSFLGAGTFKATFFEDGLNADRIATDYVKNTRQLSNSDKIMVKMAPGGGFAAILERE